MRFDGDIIITDPCYIMNHENDDKTNCPGWWDFVSKTYRKDDGTYYVPEPEDYPDARPKEFPDYLMECYGNEEHAKIRMRLDKNLKIKKLFSPTLAQEWINYSKASDEYNMAPHSDWDKCSCGENMYILGFKNYLTSYTGYGDWGCHVFRSENNEVFGEFCADAAMVGVFLLDEVLKYNPNFDYHINRKWTTTLIKDFHGEIEILKHDNGDIYVRGTGNINFYSAQTSL